MDATFKKRMLKTAIAHLLLSVFVFVLMGLSVFKAMEPHKSNSSALAEKQAADFLSIIGLVTQPLSYVFNAGVFTPILFCAWSLLMGWLFAGCLKLKDKNS